LIAQYGDEDQGQRHLQLQTWLHMTSGKHARRWTTNRDRIESSIC